MADNLDEQLQQYINLWDNIKNREFNTPLPVFNMPELLSVFTKELEDSFGADNTNRHGNNIFNHLDTIHRVTKQLHVLRDANYTDNCVL